jgi:hypothetical protein
LLRRLNGVQEVASAWAAGCDASSGGSSSPLFHKAQANVILADVSHNTVANSLPRLVTQVEPDFHTLLVKVIVSAETAFRMRFLNVVKQRSVNVIVRATLTIANDPPVIQNLVHLHRAEQSFLRVSQDHHLATQRWHSHTLDS